MAERESGGLGGGAASPPAASPFLGLHIASPPNFRCITLALNKRHPPHRRALRRLIPARGMFLGLAEVSLPTTLGVRMGLPIL